MSSVWIILLIFGFNLQHQMSAFKQEACLTLCGEYIQQASGLRSRSSSTNEQDLAPVSPGKPVCQCHNCNNYKGYKEGCESCCRYKYTGDCNWCHECGYWSCDPCCQFHPRFFRFG